VIDDSLCLPNSWNSVLLSFIYIQMAIEKESKSISLCCVFAIGYTQVFDVIVLIFTC
jgi:hypothetical protein